MPDHVNGIPPINQRQIHDLKNRLTVVKGLAQLLDRQARRDDWHREKMVRRIDQLQVEILALEAVIHDAEMGEEESVDRPGDTLH